MDRDHRPAELRARSVGISYGERVVLTGQSFDVAAGEAVALVGPSGSGKTSLLSVLGGLARPSAGSVVWTGAQVRPVIAWVHQTTVANPGRSSRANVALGAVSRGVDRLSAAILADHLLEEVGLAGREEMLVRHLSGGERQRVTIARSLAQRPEVLLADEPTGQLDAAASEVVVELLVSTAAHTRGVAVVISTHDARLAKRCDRIVSLG